MREIGRNGNEHNNSKRQRLAGWAWFNRFATCWRYATVCISWKGGEQFRISREECGTSGIACLRSFGGSGRMKFITKLFVS